MKRAALTAAVRLSVIALLAAGCSSAGTPVASPTATAVTTYGCLTEEQGRQGAVTAQDREHTNKAYFQDSDVGAAEVALIFWPQETGSLCDWVPYLGDFTKAGYAVLAFTGSGDFFDDLGPANHFLANKGFSKMVLVGSSGPAAGLLTQLSSPVDGPVQAAVALSAPRRSGSWDAARMVAIGKLPTFFAAGQDEESSSADARALYEASASPGKQLKLYPGAGRGADLLKDGALPDVLAFLARYAPPRS